MYYKLPLFNEYLHLRNIQIVMIQFPLQQNFEKIFLKIMLACNKIDSAANGLLKKKFFVIKSILR